MNKFYSLLAVVIVLFVALSAYKFVAGRMESPTRAPLRPLARRPLRGPAATTAVARAPSSTSSSTPAAPPARPSVAAPTPAPTRSSGQPTAAPAAPAARATTPAAPRPTAAPALPAPAVSQQEAEGVVRGYYQALAAKNYERMRGLTVGQARQVTDGIIAQIQGEEERLHIQAEIHVARLDIGNVSLEPSAARVTGSFSIDILGRVGPLTHKVATQSGQGVFVVQRVGGQAVITEIAGEVG